ncbi:MAG TPA: hypothetical protein VGK20_11955 [Candidatus Binatia bacterium]|jgi:YVTN family beta-propeller protein
MNKFRLFAGGAFFAAALLVRAAPASAFVTFESGQVRPLAMSPDGQRLFVCNTPDNRLEIFDITGQGLTHVTSVPVGLEPVAVAARTNTEVWVVNHLSDSVSIIDISNINEPRVTRSLTVGDEPRDIVFAGPSFDHAYITTAHRGQNIPFDPQLTTPGVGRADVWVFDANDLGSSFGGDEKAVITLFGDTPRPLAVSADGKKVYAGVFLSGNQTTTLGEGVIPNGGPGMGGMPNPGTDSNGDPRPEVGLIVHYDGTKWTDELNRDWSSSVMFNLPDFDVFTIDSNQNPPVASGQKFAHVGTTLFNMAINPGDGKLFVSNLESFNQVRFEGPGTFFPSTVRGHIVESRISVIDPVGETVVSRNINKHIDYNAAFPDPPNDVSEKSLAFPIGITFNAAGSKLYVAALGSSKIGVYTPSQIEDDSFVVDTANQIEVTGGGPTGVVLDEANGRLYALTRFDDSVSVIDTAMNQEEAHLSLHNPEPASVVAGRPFLYNARLTSSRGDQACASCHIFGDFDALAWDLGNPDGTVLNNPQPFVIGPVGNANFHPMKGPMTTQSLRGMDNEGPMHWRGDRTGGNDDLVGGNPNNVQPDHGVYNEDAAFKKFNVAFSGLVGRTTNLTDDQMQAFTTFILQVMYPPNPNRALDNSLTSDQATGQGIFFARTIDTLEQCNGCHVTDRNGNANFNVAHPGFFGTDGRSSFENETQHFKIPHLRNLYQKVGMFGNAAEAFINPGDNGFQGDQIRGFGFLHDGSTDTLFRFFNATVFDHATMPLANDGFHSDTERRQMEQFALAFDSNHRPIVGQQATLSSTSGGDASTRISLMLARADAMTGSECDVVVKGVVGGVERGWLYEGGGKYVSDRAADGEITDMALRAFAGTAGQELTFTAVPVGEGERIGIDRDLDGFGDADETANGGDPTNPIILPCMTDEPSFAFQKVALQDSKGRLQVTATVTLSGAYTGSPIYVDVSDGGGTIFAGGLDGSSLVASSSGKSWKYKAAKGTTGITKAMVKATNAPNVYKVTMKTDQAWTAPAADETTATTNVVLHVVSDCFSGNATSVKQ